jgi:hypothetical protein
MDAQSSLMFVSTFYSSVTDTMASILHGFNVKYYVCSDFNHRALFVARLSS